MTHLPLGEEDFVVAEVDVVVPKVTVDQGLHVLQEPML